VMTWRKAREKNFRVLVDTLSGAPWGRVFCPSSPGGAVPFACIILFDSAERREFVRRKLIQADIFPAVLWPLEHPAISVIDGEYVSASRRMLSIHCDMRYSTDDMARVADLLTCLGNGYGTVIRQ
jgi:hypothetical protein